MSAGHIVRIEALAQCGEAREIGRQHGDLPPLLTGGGGSGFGGNGRHRGGAHAIRCIGEASRVGVLGIEREDGVGSSAHINPVEAGEGSLRLAEKAIYLSLYTFVRHGPRKNPVAAVTETLPVPRTFVAYAHDSAEPAPVVESVPTRAMGSNGCLLTAWESRTYDRGICG